MPADPLVVGMMSHCPCERPRRPADAPRNRSSAITHGSRPRCRTLFDLIVPVAAGDLDVSDMRGSRSSHAQDMQRIIQARMRRAAHPASHAPSLRLTPKALNALRTAVTLGTLKPQHYLPRIVEVACTIADLAGTDLIGHFDIEQALAYRFSANNKAFHIPAS